MDRSRAEGAQESLSAFIRIRVIAPKVAMMDAGIAWLSGRLGAAWQAANAPQPKGR
jgi:hypothetical protein